MRVRKGRGGGAGLAAQHENIVGKDPDDGAERNHMENPDDSTERNHIENPDDSTERNHIENQAQQNAKNQMCW